MLLPPSLQVPLAPAATCRANAKLLGDVALQALRSQQNDARRLRQRTRATGHEPRQLRFLLLIGENNRRCNSLIARSISKPT